MAQIPFTLRELKRAWMDLHAASKKLPRGNAHRLLLFYAIECGLKAVWIKRENRSLYNGLDARGESIGGKSGHDLSEVIKQLGLSAKLSPFFNLCDVRNERRNILPRRNCRFDTVHQAWRYGGTLEFPPADDVAIEMQLEQIHRLIQKELKS